MATNRWPLATLTGANARLDGARLPVLAPGDVAAPIGGLDVWDMWPVAGADGRALVRGGREWWFFLAAARGGDPEARHHAARIHLLGRAGDDWRDHGPALPDGLSPGAREWSGSALLAPDGETLTLFFTAAGDRDGGPHFRQRLFQTTGRLLFDGAAPRLVDWSEPVESVAADGRWYAIADQPAPVNGGIKGFRDPGYFRDPADGSEHLLFTGSAGAGDDGVDGVVGHARRDGGEWRLGPPIVDARGANSELERPHIVAADGRYYLFWSTQGRRFARSVDAPTGLYAMTAETMAGPWRPVNGGGLVAGNPAEAPHQAYCWWVTGDSEVLSFVDYPGDGDPHAADATWRRARFGGVPAPAFRLRFDGDVVTIA